MGERGAGNAARGVEGFPMSDLHEGRSAQLDRVLADLLRQSPEVEAASVVSFDGLPMASALPAAMDENRVAAMSAALLSLGERAAEGLGRGELSQVYVEGESGTVFLISADDEAVLVAVGARGAKVGLLLYEIRRAAAEVGAALRGMDDEPEPVLDPEPVVAETVDYEAVARTQPIEVSVEVPTEIVSEAVEPEPSDFDYEPVVDEADPLGLGDLGHAGPDDVTADTAGSEEDAESWPEPKPDLGAWATFTPGASVPKDTSWS